MRTSPLIAIDKLLHNVGSLPAGERPAAVAKLRSDLHTIAKNDIIDPDTRIHLLTIAARLVAPALVRQPPPATTPSAALEILEDFLSRVGHKRSVGQPTIGSATKVALPDYINTWLDEEARRLGLGGKSPRAAAVRAVVISAWAANLKVVDPLT